MKEKIKKILAQYNKALTGRYGIGGTLAGLLILIVFVMVLVYILPYLVRIVMVLFNVSAVLLVIALLALVSIPYVFRWRAKRDLSHNYSKRSEHFKASVGSAVICSDDSSLNFIDINVSYANVKFFFSNDVGFNLEYQIIQGNPSDLSYMLDYQKDTGSLSFYQGPLHHHNKLSYNLFITLPTNAKVQLKGRFIEGSLNITGGNLTHCTMDAINVNASFKDVIFDDWELSGLNVELDAAGLTLNNANIKATGSNFRLAMATNERGGRLKTSAALSSFFINGKNLGKIFNHGSFTLWESSSLEAAICTYEFNVINSRVDFYREG
jgi:hypothetical protein